MNDLSDLSPVFKPKHLKVFDISLTEAGFVLSTPDDFTDFPNDVSAAIGSFDGVHLGHQRVIHEAVSFAKSNGGKSAVIFFNPHPQSYFQPQAEPFRLMATSQQLRAFEALGVDYAYCIAFNKALSGLSAHAFATELLSKRMKLLHLSSGFDFRFGQRGSGDADALKTFGNDLGFTTSIVALQSDETGHKLSSSGVREALINGDPQLAGHILGRPQAFMGQVILGDQIGRKLGFKTANMGLGSYLRPKYGVYVTRTTLSDGQVFGSVTNFGKRPTLGGLAEQFESHIFGLEHDIYNQVIEVDLLHYLRPEQKFLSLDALKAQIKKDADAAQAYFT
jgi:riboflavin kinase / FMN adenylyltransferase